MSLTEQERLERESLRRQYELLHEIRSRVWSEPADWYDAWSEALMPLTDDIIHRLMELEGVPPYPHPRGTWDELGDMLDEAFGARASAEHTE